MDIKKKKAMGFFVLAFLITNSITAVVAETQNTASVIDERSSEVEMEKQARISEEMKVIIGVPSTIDIGDSIPVVVAGMRDAKAKYIKPIRMKIELISSDPTQTETDNEDEVLIATKESWYYENQWIAQNDSTSIDRLNDYLYLAEFDPLNQEVVVIIRAYIDWVAPWNEIFTSVGERVVGLGSWANYTQYLETSADDVRSEVVSGFNDDAANATGLLGDIKARMAELREVTGLQGILSDLNVPDPSYFHFYLLNITTIINGSDPNSYVGQLDDSAIYLEGKTEKQYYIDLLGEINQAFTESLKILDRKNVPYTITHVNYTYTDTIYDSTLDADWDDENLNDTSFEFLIENNFWSGHPDHLHQDMFVSFDTPSDGYYTMEELGNSYNADLWNPAYQETEWKNEGGRLDHLNLYEGFVDLYSNVSGILVTLEEGVDYEVNGSTSIHIMNSSLDGDDCFMVVEKPGGWRKTNKAIIINLMADLFPIMNRFYFTPRGLSDDNNPYNIENGLTFGDEGYINRYYLDPTNGNYIAPPIQQVLLQSDGSGNVDDSWLENPINIHILPSDQQYGNITDYLFYLSSIDSGVPHWINTVSKPFGRFVYDDNVLDGDSYNDEYTEDDFYTYLDGSIGDELDAEGYETPHLPLFSIMDISIGITSDEYGGSILPHKTNQWDAFYKNDWGDTIDAFFNGTNLLDGSDRTSSNNTGPDMSYSYPNSWTFRYINRDTSELNENDLPSEYQLSPFQSMSDYTPVGLMTSGSITFLQNSLLNLTAGFGYCYGLIYDVYRRAYEANKAILLTLIRRTTENENYDAAQAIQGDIELLDQSWDELNLTLLDEIGLKVDDYMNNPDNVYTGTGEKSFLQNAIDNVQDSVDSAVNRLSQHEKTANTIDGELDGTSYDVRKLGILEEIITWLNTSVREWLINLESTTSREMYKFSSGFNDSVDTCTTTFNKSIVSFNNTLGNWSNNIAGNFTEFGSAVVNKSIEAAGSLQGAITGIAAGLGLVVGAVTMTAIAVMMSSPMKPWIWALGVIAITIVAGVVGSFSENTIATKVEELGMSVGGAIDKVGGHIKNGIDLVNSRVTEALYKASSAVTLAGNQLKKAVGKINEVVTNIVEKMTDMGMLIIDQTVLIIKSINETLNLVQGIIEDVFNKIQSVYDEVKRQIQKVGQFVIEIMGESLGRVKDLMNNVSGTVFEKLKSVGEQILNHSAFVKVQHLYDKVVSATSSAGFTQYSTEYGEVTEDVILRWADTMQPLAEIQSAERGFYVFQMGDEFAEQLYYVVVHDGELVDPDEIDFRIRRWADLSDYGGEGEQLLEAYPVVNKFQVNGTPIDGIYYVDFEEGTRISWYKENSVDPYVNASAPAGNYLTMFNATINSVEKWNYENIEAYWVEKTVLFTKEYILDAFPVISIAGYNPDNPEPYVVEAGGDEIILDIDIRNEMWSDPNVQVDLILTTRNEDTDLDFDGGTTLAQLRYSNVPLQAENSTNVAAAWSVGKYTPSGRHLLLIAVTETNGDVTVISVPMTVEQDNVLINFLGSLFTDGSGFGIIGMVIAILGGGGWMYFRKTSKLKRISVDTASASKKVSAKVSKNM